MIRGDLMSDPAAGMLDRILGDVVSDACLAAVRPLAIEVAALRRAIEEHLPVSFISRPEAAERLGVSVDTVDRMVREGRITSRRIGRAVRIDPRSLRGPSGGEIALAASIARGKR